MATDVVPSFSRLDDDEYADVCIVGAGIAGLTTAYWLSRLGKSVIVLDDGPIVSGETKRSTAHLATALDSSYVELEWLHGEGGARLAAESHAAAIDQIEQIVFEEKIDCEFERLDGYLFTTLGEPPEALDRELAAAQRAGLTETSIVERAPLASYHTGKALRFPRQAQFNPLKYLAALAQAIIRDGGRIYTKTHATHIAGGEPARIETRDGPVVTASVVVVATNTPVNDMLAIHTKQTAYRTYVIGAGVPTGSINKGLYWDTTNPYHVIRLQTLRSGSSAAPAGDLLIVGGEDHKTGQADDAAVRYKQLEEWTRSRFPMTADIRFRWSGQVVESMDGVAFIGRNPMDKQNVFIATGFSGNGMTCGAITGRLLTDLILGLENPWVWLYEPSRKTMRAAERFAKEALNTAAQYGKWLTRGDVSTAALVTPGTGAIVRRGLNKIAVYCDDAGQKHECSAVCPHLGGIVAWNHSEESWDCPCHGSRFNKLGKLLNGPANTDLQIVVEPQLVDVV